MRPRKALREAVVFGIDDEVDVAQPVQGHILRAVARHRREPHGVEQPAQIFRLWRRVFDEFESVRLHGILDVHGRSPARCQLGACPRNLRGQPFDACSRRRTSLSLVYIEMPVRSRPPRSASPSNSTARAA